MGRRMQYEEYRAVKDLIDGKLEGKNALARKGKELADQIQENFIEFITPYYENVMNRVAELSKIAIFEKKLNIIIFPEGTRSTKLGEGKTGLAQLAINTDTTVVPVGCNNTDRIYPGSSPFAKSGQVTYRVGAPLSFDGALKECRVKEDFKLFSEESRLQYRDKFEEATRIIMERINSLVDERYRV